ncbi:MAG: SDH family Clp fold serine proteinase [Candidatus Hydrogenedentota bacterium]
MSALKDLSGDKLDLIIHSPGGQAETTEQLVNYLRKKYSHIRAIVPQNAMSAATMLACAADEIVMGKHSALGPIDPQFRIDNQSVPAQAILDEFQTALDEIAKGAKPTLWIKRLEGLTPGFLKSCENAIELSRDLVRLWLSRYMFADDPQGDKKAYSIAEWLGAHANFKTHGRPIGIDMASEKGLKVLALEENQAFQEAVLSVFHAAEATFETTSCFKIIENHLGSGMYYTSKEK